MGFFIFFAKSVWEIQNTCLLWFLCLLGLQGKKIFFFFFEIDFGSPGYLVIKVTWVTRVTRQDFIFFFLKIDSGSLGYLNIRVKK